MNFTEFYGNAKFVQPTKSCISPQMRAVISIESKPENAHITVCGLGFFEMQINGNSITSDRFVPPNSHYHHYDNCFCYKEFGEQLAFRIYSCRYDVTGLLNVGKNVITATLAPGWYAPYGECKLCYSLDCDKNIFVSDDNIKWRDSGMSYYSITKGEEYSTLFNTLNDGCFLPDYDDSSWNSTKVVAAPDSNYCLSECPHDKVIRKNYPVKIRETADTYVYDCGENITGTPLVRCKSKNKKVNVAFSEDLGKRGGFNKERTYEQHLSFISDGTDKINRLHFTWGTFRYIQIPKCAEIDAVEVINADTPLTAEFSCDNSMLNALFDIYVRTQLDNIHAGIPSDCPHIERRGYTGDGQLTCETVMLLFDCKEFYKKWMEDISDCQDRVSGHIQYTAPYICSGGGPGGWGCAIIEVPYVYYKTYGDSEPLKKYFNQMLKYIDYLEAHSKNGLVVDDQPGQWHLGDWCTPSDSHGGKPIIPDPFVNTYFYVKSLMRMCKIAKVTGNDSYIDGFIKLAEKKKQIILDNFYNSETGDFCQNENSANAFVLDIGLGDTRTLINLNEKLRKLGAFDSGIFGTDLVIKILFKNGFADTAASLLSSEKYPSYGYMIKNGATTIWEEWRNPRSMCHPMFGAPVRFLFYYLLGIIQKSSSCGYTEVVFNPVKATGINKVSGAINTASGKISVKIDYITGTAIIIVPNGIKINYMDKILPPGENTIDLK